MVLRVGMDGRLWAGLLPRQAHTPTFSVNEPTTPINTNKARVASTTLLSVKSLPEMALMAIITGKRIHPSKK